MDRPEWVAAHTMKPEVYCCLTNNKNRGVKTNAGGDLTAVGWLVFLSAVGGASAQVAVGALSDRWGRRGALAVALAVGAVNTAVYGQIDAFGALLALWVPYAFASGEAQRDRVCNAGVLHQPNLRAAGGHGGRTAGGASRRGQLHPRRVV